MGAGPPSHTWQNGVIPNEYLHHARIASTAKPSHPIKSGSYPKSTVHCHLVGTHYTSWLLLHSFETTPLKVNLPNMRGAHRWGPHDPGPPYLLLAFANYLYMYTTVLRTNKRCTASPLLNVVFYFRTTSLIRFIKNSYNICIFLLARTTVI